MRWLILPLALLAACSSSGAGPTGGSGGGGGSGGQPPAEICDNGIDDDGNDAVDCADTACGTDAHCPFCGDGLRQGAELCDGAQLGDADCRSLHFNSGGPLACKPDCTFDTSGCKSHEDCDIAGDEDGNGKSDCADAACAALDTCVVLQFVNLPHSPHYDSAQTLQVRVLDGAGAGMPGRSVHLTGSAGASIATPSATTDADGWARFDVLVGRHGAQAFSATLGGSSHMANADLQAVDPPTGNVHTVVNASHQLGTDSTGPAVSARIGKIVGMAVKEDETLVLAQGCQILAVSPEGVLSVLAGTGACGTAEDGSQALSAPIAVTDLALDAANNRLVFVDPSVDSVRAIDLVAGTISTLAGGGTGGDGPATDAALRPNALAVAPDGSLYISDVGTQSMRRVDPAGTISTPVRAGVNCSSDVNLVECLVHPCRPLVDSAGNAFVAATLCGSAVDKDMPDGPTPGIARIVRGSSARGHLVPVLGNAAGLGALGQTSTEVKIDGPPLAAFDPAGNLFAIAGRQLLGVDDRTWATQALATWKDASFSGEDVPVAQAKFAQPSAMAFGPAGDLYIADGEDGSVRRVVAAGQTKLQPLTVTITAGDGGIADLGQKVVPALAVTIKDGDKTVRGRSIALIPDDPSIAVYPGADTDTAGAASRTVRMGFAPGEHTVSVSLSDLHGALVPDAAVFHLTATEPPVGNILTVVNVAATDPSTPFVLEPGERVPATLAALRPPQLAVAPDGVSFLSTNYGQILSLSAGGVLELVAGGRSSLPDGDGGPAVDAYIQPGAIAATREMIYFRDGVSGGRVRGIDRATGIIRTYVSTLDAYALAVGPDGQLFATTNNKVLLRVDPASGTTSTLTDIHADCQAGVDGLLQTPSAMNASSAGIAFAGYGCHDGEYNYWVGSIDTDGTLHFLVGAYAMFVDVAPDGAVLFADYTGLYRIDPVTGMLTLLGGGGAGIVEDKPATQSSLYPVGNGGGYDSKGHLWLSTDPGIRVIW